MTELLSVSTVLPEQRVTAADTQQHLAGWLPPDLASRFRNLVDASRNETRYGVVPLAELERLNTLESRNPLYIHHAVRLGETAVTTALREAGIAPSGITAMIGVSSTGYMMPSLETRLLDRLGIASTCLRIPLTQLGCAGGAVALRVGSALCTGAPAQVLVVSVELPSLSFPTAEPSPVDVAASIQFGDGAAAAVLSSARSGVGPELIAHASRVFPGTIDRDGAILTANGMRLIRPRGLADILRRHVANEVDHLLARSALSRSDIAFWVIHPRNPELLDAVAAGLGLSDGALEASRAVWRRTGNTVSAAVFHVLRELAQSQPPREGEYGVMIAFGAGFSCEIALLRAAGWLCEPRATRNDSGAASDATQAS